MKMVKRGDLKCDVDIDIPVSKDGYEVWTEFLKTQYYDPQLVFYIQHPDGSILDVDRMGFFWIPNAA